MADMMIEKFLKEIEERAQLPIYGRCCTTRNVDRLHDVMKAQAEFRELEKFRRAFESVVRTGQSFQIQTETGKVNWKVYRADIHPSLLIEEEWFGQRLDTADAQKVGPFKTGLLVIDAIYGAERRANEISKETD